MEVAAEAKVTNMQRGLGPASRPKTAVTDKANSGDRDDTRRLQPVPGQVGEVLGWLPEAEPPQCIGHSTTDMGVLPQGHPNRPQEQRLGQ